jgi:hypothetical protein
VVFPSVAMAATFDDNVYGGSGNKEQAMRYELSPAMQLKSDFTRHQLNLMLGGHFATYPDFEDQQFIGGYAASDWRIDIDHANAVGGRVQVKFDQEERLVPDAPSAAAAPTDILSESADIAYTHDAGRLALSTGLDFNATDYRDTVARDGTPIEQDYRDNTAYGAFVRLNYRYLAGYRFLAAAEVRRTDFWDDSPFTSDYTSYRSLLGASIDVDPLLKLNVSGGYGINQYDDGGTADTYLLSASLIWIATDRATFTLAGTRELTSSAKENGGVIESKAELRLDYELTHDINLRGEASYRNLDFSVSGRQDDIYSVGAHADYFLNENVIFTFGYQHLTRDSSLPEFDDDDNRFTLGMRIRF